MVAASSAMRFTSATYSSRRPGRRRERKTVTIIVRSSDSRDPTCWQMARQDQIDVCDRCHAGRQYSSAPLPKFVIHGSTLRHELRKQKGTSAANLKFLSDRRK